MVTELPSLGVPLPRRLLEPSNLANKLFALVIPSSKVFLELVLQITNLWVRLRRILAWNGTAHDLGSAAKLHCLSGYFDLLLFPFRFCAEERLLNVCLFLSDTIEFEFELFLYRLGHAQWVRCTRNGFSECTFEPTDFRIQLRALAFPFFGHSRKLLVGSFLDPRDCAGIGGLRFFISTLTCCLSLRVCQRRFQLVDFGIQTAPFRAPSFRC